MSQDVGGIPPSVQDLVTWAVDVLIEAAERYLEVLRSARALSESGVCPRLGWALYEKYEAPIDIQVVDAVLNSIQQIVEGSVKVDALSALLRVSQS